MAPTVFAALGVESLDVGFPGDSAPSGPVWQTTDAAGIARWCSWYSPEPSRIIELNIQPGVSEPSTDLLQAAAATPTEVGAADSAWNIPPSGTDITRLLTVTGRNRLTVAGLGDGVDMAAVSTAVLAQLEG